MTAVMGWRGVAAAGGALAAAGSILPWTARPLPAYRGQNLSIAAFFEGPRQFTLILAALLVVLSLIPLPRGLQRAQGVFALALGSALLTAGDLVAEIWEGRGIGAVAVGVLLTTAGFAVAAVAAGRTLERRAGPVGPVLLGLGSYLFLQGILTLGWVDHGMWRRGNAAEAFAGIILVAIGGTRLTAATKPPQAPPWRLSARRGGWLIEGAIVFGAILLAFWAAYDLFLFDEPVLFLTLLGAVLVVGWSANRVGLMGPLSDIFLRRKVMVLVLLFAVLVAFPLTQQENIYPVRILASAGLFAAAALGLNVVVGSAGLLDLGYIAFFGIGAYVAAIFGGNLDTIDNFHIPFFWVFILACVVSGIAGVVLGAPTLRLRGDYLAIVTLGFGEIVRRVMENLNLTHGNVGVAGVPHLKIGSLDFSQNHEVAGRTVAYFANYYYLELLYLVAIIFVVSRINRSRIGRAWVAIREDELAASAMGVNTIAIKLLAFGVGAFFAGGAGSIFTHLNSQVSPDSFQFIESVTVLAMVVLGGMGNIGGVILGAVLLIVLPEKLRFFADYRLLLFGAALVLMMRFRPEGLIPSARRRREFREGVGSSMGATPGSGAIASPAGTGGG